VNVERDWGDIVHARKYIENVCFDSVPFGRQMALATVRLKFFHR